MSAARPGPAGPFVQDAVAAVRVRTRQRTPVALVLGSGLGDAVLEDLTTETDIAFTELPGFPAPSVPGHAGRLLIGELYGEPAAVFSGRVHYYEGHGAGATTLIPLLAAELGARTIVLTNASGGLDPALRVGQLMLITDHMNLQGVNPLHGWRFADGAPAFVDQSAVYDPGLLAAARTAAPAAGVDLTEGVYAAVPGPTYETPAETAMLAALGARAVGMSTVPEAMAANALGLRVMGVSCVTDVAGTELTHQEVLAAARGAAPDLRAILAGVMPVAVGNS